MKKKSVTKPFKNKRASWDGYVISFQVIANTIQKDLKKITDEGRQVERDLRAERVRLIRTKVEESGGDVKALTEAGIISFLKK